MKKQLTSTEKLKIQLVDMGHKIAELEESESRRCPIEQELRESETKYSTLVEQSTDAVLITQDEVFQFASQAVKELYGYTVEEMTSMPSIMPTVAPECRRLVTQRHRARLAGEELHLHYDDVRIQCKDGTTKEVETSSRLIHYKGKSATMAIVRDISQRKAAEREAIRRNRELAALYAVLMATTRTLDLGVSLKEIVRRVGDVLDSVYTIIDTVDEEGKLGVGSEHFVGIAPIPDLPRPIRIAESIIANGNPLIVDDGDSAKEANPLHLAIGVKSYAGVPIRTKAGTIGVLLVHSLKPGAFAGCTDFLSAFADQAAIAMQNARLYETLKAQHSRVEQLLAQVLTAQEDERRRLSLDLHDTITQSVYGVLAHIRTAEEWLSRYDFDGLQNELHHARAASEETIVDLRRVVHGLRPPILDDRGIAKALRQHIHEIQRKDTNLAVRFKVTGQQRRLSPGLEIGIYRVAQEALSNARRHAGASKIDTVLRFHKDCVCLEVRDNGSGFDFCREIDRRKTDGHMGLAGMKERAELMSGELQVDSRPGAGTEVRLVVPTSSVQAIYGMFE